MITFGCRSATENSRNQGSSSTRGFQLMEDVFAERWEGMGVLVGGSGEDVYVFQHANG